MQKFEGFPKFLWYGSEGDYNVMATSLLGPSILDLQEYC